MTTRQMTLLLRYVANVLAGEELAYHTRRALRDTGMDDAAIDEAVARVKRAVEVTQ